MPAAPTEEQGAKAVYGPEAEVPASLREVVYLLVDKAMARGEKNIQELVQASIVRLEASSPQAIRGRGQWRLDVGTQAGTQAVERRLVRQAMEGREAPRKPRKPKKPPTPPPTPPPEPSSPEPDSDDEDPEDYGECPACGRRGLKGYWCFSCGEDSGMIYCATTRAITMGTSDWWEEAMFDVTDDTMEDATGVSTNAPARESMGPKRSALTRGGKGTDVAGEKAETAKRPPSKTGKRKGRSESASQKAAQNADPETEDNVPTEEELKAMPRARLQIQS